MSESAAVTFQDGHFRRTSHLYIRQSRSTGPASSVSAQCSGPRRARPVARRSRRVYRAPRALPFDGSTCLAGRAQSRSSRAATRWAPAPGIQRAHLSGWRRIEVVAEAALCTSPTSLRQAPWALSARCDAPKVRGTLLMTSGWCVPAMPEDKRAYACRCQEWSETLARSVGRAASENCHVVRRCEALQPLFIGRNRPQSIPHHAIHIVEFAKLVPEVLEEGT